MAGTSAAAASSSTVTDDYQKIKNADRSKYRSLPVMTKYEFDQVIGLRTMHLSKGAIPLVDIPEDFKIQTNMELRDIALRELADGKLPYTIKRMMPNGKPEYWDVKDLSLVAVQHMMR